MLILTPTFLSFLTKNKGDDILAGDNDLRLGTEKSAKDYSILNLNDRSASVTRYRSQLGPGQAIIGYSVGL